MITYEYPLVERIRTMLRLEDLFERARFYVDRTEAPEHHSALLTLFEILDVTGPRTRAQAARTSSPISSRSSSVRSR